jgi:hypothetical protein
VSTIYERFDYVQTSLFEERLDQEGQRAQRYSSQHIYSLEQFDLQADTIVEEFSDVFEVIYA